MWGIVYLCLRLTRASCIDRLITPHFLFCCLTNCYWSCDGEIDFTYYDEISFIIYAIRFLRRSILRRNNTLIRAPYWRKNVSLQLLRHNLCFSRHKKAFLLCPETEIRQILIKRTEAIWRSFCFVYIRTAYAVSICQNGVRVLFLLVHTRKAFGDASVSMNWQTSLTPFLYPID